MLNRAMPVLIGDDYNFGFGALAGEESVSLVIPVYNEGECLLANLSAICEFLDSHSKILGCVEVVLVDDGSTDITPHIIDRLAFEDSRVRAFHHPRNLGLGKALETGFSVSRGQLVITFDSDLTYSLDHLGVLINEARKSGADVIVTSPYMRGGTARHVPTDRLLLSRTANLLLKLIARGRLSTFTGMVRLYRRDFLHSIKISALGPEVNLELLHYAFSSGAVVREIPGHMNWGVRRFQLRGKVRVKKVWRQALHVLHYGRLIRQVV